MFYKKNFDKKKDRHVEGGLATGTRVKGDRLRVVGCMQLGQGRGKLHVGVDLQLGQG